MSTKKLSCKCHPDSPFHWKHNPRPSIFRGDVNFRATADGQTFSQVSTRAVETLRSKGINAGYVKGISKNREEEILRMRTFHMFTAAISKETTHDKKNERPK